MKIAMAFMCLAGVSLLLAGSGVLPARADAPADASRGEKLFARNCRICHGPGQPGHFMLERRLGAGLADLEQRHAVAADYVKTVVRGGLNGMPPIQRGTVGDADLDAIIAYLNRPVSR